MLQEIADLIRQNKRARLAVVAVFGLLILLPVFSLLWLQAKYPQYQAGQTGMSLQSNFGRLSGSTVYGYNGISFFAADLRSAGKAAILNRPGRLPAPNSLYWANDKGALLSFKDSFAGTRIEQALTQQGKQIDEETRAYTWYLSFSDNTLRLAYPGAILPNLAVYSTADKGFYFIPEQPSLGNVEGAAPLRPASDGDAQLPLYFYSVTDNTVSALDNNLPLSSVNYLAECRFRQQRICLIGLSGQSSASQFLYAVNGQGNATKLLQSTGRLLPTNRPAQFITAEPRSQPNQQTNGNSGASADTEPSPAILRNVETGSQVELGFDIGIENVVAYISGDSFYMVSGGIRTANGLGGYRSGIVRGQKADFREYPLLIDNNQYNGGVVDIASYGDDGITLLSASNGNQILVYPASLRLQNTGNLSGQPKILAALPVEQLNFSIKAEYANSSIYIVITPNLLANNLTEEEYTSAYSTYYQSGRRYLTGKGYSLESSEYKVVSGQQFRDISR